MGWVTQEELNTRELRGIEKGRAGGIVKIYFEEMKLSITEIS